MTFPMEQKFLKIYNSATRNDRSINLSYTMNPKIRSFKCTKELGVSKISFKTNHFWSKYLLALFLFSTILIYCHHLYYILISMELANCEYVDCSKSLYFLRREEETSTTFPWLGKLTKLKPLIKKGPKTDQKR